MNGPSKKQRNPGKQPSASRGFQITKDPVVHPIHPVRQKTPGHRPDGLPPIPEIPYSRPNPKKTSRTSPKKAAPKELQREQSRPKKSVSLSQHPKPKKSLGERLLTDGILVLVLAIAVSLLVYFHPFTWEDVCQTARHGVEKLHDLALTGIEKLQEWTSPQLSENDNAKDDPSAGKDTRSITEMDRTSELGSISNFSLEPTAPIQEDSIFTCMLDTALGPMLYYNQGDIRWKDYLYGGSDPMSRYGCGPSCVAMVIGSFSSTPVSPVEMADWSAENGGYALHGGSYHNLIPDSISAFGLQVDSITDRSVENVTALLRSGHILVALMGKGSLTQNGHFIVIAQLCQNGNVYIADPANYENCTKEWDLQQLMDELKESYDHGGPLWAVSIPEAQTVPEAEKAGGGETS